MNPEVFESAADAVVDGRAEAIAGLLADEAGLIRARSPRPHRATLLHYVSANGVEDQRQRTPPNAVGIARLLLDAGAEVDAVLADGGSATLALVASSVHPQRAGLQIPLIELLLERGASIDGVPGGCRPVNAALANGRPAAAEVLANRGAALDLEAAAGLGRMDVLAGFFAPDGSLRGGATREQAQAGFMWACEYGRDAAVEFLLAHGVGIGARDRNGMTGLHWAVVGARPETIRLLLLRGAQLDAVNGYGGTVLGQAVWSAENDPTGVDYRPVLHALLDSGARVDAEPGLAAHVAALLRD